MDRRRFEHLFVELSVACGQLVPRYRLWLTLREAGADPERLARRDAIGFCDDLLARFLDDQGLSLTRWRRRKLRRSVAGFDPDMTSPDELMERLERESI